MRKKNDETETDVNQITFGMWWMNAENERRRLEPTGHARVLRCHFDLDDEVNGAKLIEEFEFFMSWVDFNDVK